MEKLSAFWETYDEYQRPNYLSGLYYSRTYATIKDDTNVIRFADKDAVYLASKSRCKVQNGVYLIDSGALLRITCVTSIKGEDLDSLIRNYIK